MPGQVYPKPERFLAVDQMKTALRSVPFDKLLFMGGEPTVAKELPEMLDFGKNTLGVKTYLGHTNGSRLPLPNLDGANVGLKAWDDQVHLRYTGRPKQPIFDNFAAAVRRRAGHESQRRVHPRFRGPRPDRGDRGVVGVA